MFEKYVGHQRQELFHLAATTIPASSQQETDLFAGIEEFSASEPLVRSA
jgi:hypothetical protein